MGRIEGKKLIFELAGDEIREFELNPQNDFELVKAKKGIWVLLETEKEKKRIFVADETEQKIFRLLKKRDLKERVEGAFEKLLSPAEQIKLEKMLSDGIVEKFKLNEKYKKAIYRI
ncbi:MAG: hypothetical protein HYW50_02420, partial [Candidatus Diapherotrites archaeon]|nr:hypothetical protein [Candidatus Diapherotrites archaeon]